MRVALPGAQGVQAFLDFRLVATLGRLIVAPRFRDVLLLHPAAFEVVAVLIAGTVSQFLGAAIAGVAQVFGHRQRAAGTDIVAGLADCHGRGIRLGSGGNVGDRLRECQLAFGQADKLACLQCGRSDHQGLRIGVAHILRGADDDSPGNEARVLAGFQHACQPVDGRVRVAAAHALNEGAGQVVVRVAGRVVIEHLPLDGILGHLEREFHRLLLGRENADLERRQGPARVAVADLCQELQCVGVQVHREIAEAAFLVGQGAAHNRLDMLARERLERENLAAAQQRRVDGEERVLRRGADERDAAFLDIGQQHILLGAVEAVQLVHEEDRPPGCVLQLATRFLEKLAHFLRA